MDPKACLIAAQRHINDGDKIEAGWSLADYRGWRRAGGFEPVMDDGRAGDMLARDLHYRLTCGNHPTKG